MSELIDLHWPSTVARTTGTTVEHNLRRKSNSWEGILVHNIDPISEGGSGPMSPAGTAVLRNMLVSGPREVVNTINVAPVPVGRDVLNIENFMRKWHGDVSWSGSLWSNDFISVEESVLGSFIFLLNFSFKTREEVLNILDRFRFLGAFSTFFTFSPGINGSSKSTVSFNSDVVDASDDSEESIFSEMLTPRVSDFPELDSVFNTISHNGDIMDDISIVGHVVENTAGVVFEGIWNRDSASHWASLIDLVHDGLFVLGDRIGVTGDMAVLVHSVDIVLVWDPATFARGTVSADDVVGTFDSRVVTSCLVVRAGFISHIIVVHPLKC
jgi:hypothetical protein